MEQFTKKLLTMTFSMMLVLLLVTSLVIAAVTFPISKMVNTTDYSLDVINANTILNVYVLSLFVSYLIISYVIFQNSRAEVILVVSIILSLVFLEVTGAISSAYDQTANVFFSILHSNTIIVYVKDPGVMVVIYALITISFEVLLMLKNKARIERATLSS